MAQSEVSDLVADDELGIHYRSSIKAKLALHLPQIFGYHALLYSPLAQLLCGESLSIKHQVVIGQKNTNSTTLTTDLSLVCSYNALPIAADTIDLAVLPNILQNSVDPHQILREVERVLIPEGVIILIGRNPYSWLGVRKIFARWRNHRKPLNTDISRRRIEDWFRLLGFESDSLIAISPYQEKIANKRLSPWLKKSAQYLCEYFCSYYIIIAKKKVSTLTPIRASWRKNKQLVPSRLAEPSVKNQVENWFEQWKL